MAQLKGFVTHIIYRNNGNGYTVFELNTGDEITCVGTFQSLEEGEILELEGDFTEHAVYGSQFKVSSFKFSSPEDAAGMERYLGSGAIKGVGASLAARIVKRFGADTFRIIEEEPERLAEIKGISERKAMDIASQMEEKHEMREAMVYLQKYGISNTLAVRIYETYGSRLYRVLEETRTSLRMILTESASARRMNSPQESASTRIRIFGFERNFVYIIAGVRRRAHVSAGQRF